VTARRCGACTFCCTWLAVEALDKPAGVACEHLTPHGCAIYDTRPDECRIFDCLWLQGLGDLSTRPDRMGGVVTAAPEKKLLVIFTPDLELDQHSAHVRRLLAQQMARGHGIALVKAAEPRRILAAEHDLAGIIGDMSALEDVA